MDYADGSVFMLVGILLLVDSFLLIGCVFLLSAWFLLLVDSFCWLNTFLLLALFMLSIHLFMMLNWLCCLILLVGWSLPLVTQFLYFRLNPEVDVGLELWRDVNMLCQSLHSDDVEDFGVHKMNGLCVAGSCILRVLLTVPPSYCRDVVVAGNIIQTVQAGLRQAYECIASAS
ncbi:hypothetical protein Tco_0101590, partial [Tanacetum coccineum]